MQAVNIHDAKTRLSQLLEQVEQGEDIVIARAGHPIARLIAYTAPTRQVAPPGGMAGEIVIAEDFDASLDGLFDCLEGNAGA